MSCRLYCSLRKTNCSSSGSLIGLSLPFRLSTIHQICIVFSFIPIVSLLTLQLYFWLYTTQKKKTKKPSSTQATLHHEKLVEIYSSSIYFSVSLKRYICYSPAGRSVLGETEPEVLSTARGRRPRAVLSTVSPNTDRPWPVNNIFIFFLLRFESFRKILLQPPTYVCWRRARSCWCCSKRAIDCKPKQNITTWFLTCNLYYHN